VKEEDLKALIAELKKGNNQCLQFIFEDHAEFCTKNLTRQTTCSQEEAEDIFMDAILNFREKALKGKITYLTQMRNYIYTTCINMHRVRYSQQLKAIQRKEEVLMYFQSGEVEVEQENSFEEQRMDLTVRALRKLDKKCQGILKSFYVDEMKMSEIAKKFNFTNANVAKTSKSRCYKKWMEEVVILNESSERTFPLK